MSAPHPPIHSKSRIYVLKKEPHLEVCLYPCTRLGSLENRAISLETPWLKYQYILCGGDGYSGGAVRAKDLLFDQDIQYKNMRRYCFENVPYKRHTCEQEE